MSIDKGKVKSACFIDTEKASYWIKCDKMLPSRKEDRKHRKLMEELCPDENSYENRGCMTRTVRCRKNFKVSNLLNLDLIKYVS